MFNSSFLNNSYRRPTKHDFLESNLSCVCLRVPVYIFHPCLSVSLRSLSVYYCVISTYTLWARVAILYVARMKFIHSLILSRQLNNRHEGSFLKAADSTYRPTCFFCLKNSTETLKNSA